MIRTDITSGSLLLRAQQNKFRFPRKRPLKSVRTPSVFTGHASYKKRDTATFRNESPKVSNLS